MIRLSSTKMDFDETKHPRDRGGKFSEKPGSKPPASQPSKPVKPQGRAKFLKRLDQDLKEDPIFPHLYVGKEKEKTARDGMDAVLSSLPEKAISALARNVKQIEFYHNLQELTGWFKSTHSNLKISKTAVIGGAWQPEQGSDGKPTGRGTLHLDGPLPMSIPGSEKQFDMYGRGSRDKIRSAAHVYAHEIGHALDARYSTKGEYLSEISRTSAWIEAWKKEINDVDDPLTRYARTSLSEGFAEFARMAMFNPADAKTDFPACWKVWEHYGYATTMQAQK
jgi:hypothetical protein